MHSTKLINFNFLSCCLTKNCVVYIKSQDFSEVLLLREANNFLFYTGKNKLTKIKFFFEPRKPPKSVGIISHFLSAEILYSFLLFSSCVCHSLRRSCMAVTFSISISCPHKLAKLPPTYSNFWKVSSLLQRDRAILNCNVSLKNVWRRVKDFAPNFVHIFIHPITLYYTRGGSL